MRGTVTIESITAKIEKLTKVEASLVKRLEDTRKQLAEQEIKKNELLAKMFTSKLDKLDMSVLQKVLDAYNKEVNNVAENEKEETAPNVNTKEADADLKEEKESRAENNSASTTQAQVEIAAPDKREDNTEQRRAPQPEHNEDDEDDEYKVTPNWVK